MNKISQQYNFKMTEMIFVLRIKAKRRRLFGVGEKFPYGIERYLQSRTKR